MRSLAIEERRAVARRPTATAFVDWSMAENDSAVAHNSFSVAASEPKATQEFTSHRGEARYWPIALVYLLAFAIAVYYRITISDWLAAHLPL